MKHNKSRQKLDKKNWSIINIYKNTYNRLLSIILK